jgi:hypothetical protein
LKETPKELKNLLFLKKQEKEKPSEIQDKDL